MVWVCFTTHDTGALNIIDGKMGGLMYRQILEKNRCETPKICTAFTTRRRI